MIDGWSNQVHEGDVLEVLAQMPESSVHMVMTSPPYWGLRDYGVDGQIGLEDSLQEYIETLAAVGEEIRRVLRPDGSWWLNLGDSFAGSGRGQWDNDEGRPKETVSHDSGQLPDREASLRRKSKMLIPHRVAIALQDAGWVVRSDGPWVKPNGMPDPVKDRLREDKEFLFHLAPNPRYWFDLDSVRVRHADASLERSGRHDHAKRGHPTSEQTLDPEQFCHPNGANPGDVHEIPVGNFPEAHFAVYPGELCRLPIKSSCPPKVCAACGTPYGRDVQESNRTVAGGAPSVPENGTGYKDRTANHQGDREGFTLPERELGDWEPACDCETDDTAPGVVLDPFAGAGTTLRVAKDLGRRFVGVELNPEYVAIAQKRVGIDVDRPELLTDDGQAALTSIPDGGRTLDAEPRGDGE